MKTNFLVFSSFLYYSFIFSDLCEKSVNGTNNGLAKIIHELKNIVGNWDSREKARN